MSLSPYLPNLSARFSKIIVLLLLASSISAQSMGTYGSPRTITGANLDTLNTKLSTYSTFYLHPLTLWSAIHYSGKDTVTIYLNTGDVTTKFFLHRSSIFPPGAKMAIQESTGEVMRDMRDDGVYRGYANDDTTQYAAFIIKKDAFSGYVRLGNIVWQVDKIGKVVSGLQGDMTTTYIIYNSVVTPPIACGTVITAPSDNDDLKIIDRDDMPVHLELAYDVDGEAYANFGSEEAIQDYLVDIAMKEENIYRTVYTGFRFYVVHINIWKDAATDIYSGDAVAHWYQCSNWWQGSTKACIRRDAVQLISGSASLGANGVVADGVPSICGTSLSTGCLNIPYSVVREVSPAAPYQAKIAAHELGHNFGLIDQCTSCSIMYSCKNGPFPNCISSSFLGTDITRLRNYAAGTSKRCTSATGPQGQNSNACMLAIPPVSLGFGLTMTKNINNNQIINLSDTSIICPGTSFQATFNNAYSNSVLWTLGPLLAFDDGYPIDTTGLKERKIKLPSTTNICSPFDSWIKVSFTYSCGTLTYQVKVKLGSSFGLDGTYAGAGGPSLTIATANSVPPGSYDIKMENPNVAYTWTQTIGTTTTTLPYTTSGFSFGISTNQSISFTASTTSECCSFSRTFAFFTGGRLLPSTGHSGGSHQVYPNPATDMLTVVFDNVASPPGTERTIEVVDVMGKVVRRLARLTDDRCEFSISHLSAGTYWLRINDGQQVQTVHIEKI